MQIRSPRLLPLIECIGVQTNLIKQLKCIEDTLEPRPMAFDCRWAQLQGIFDALQLLDEVRSRPDALNERQQPRRAHLSGNQGS
jgi:hypothetical protein